MYAPKKYIQTFFLLVCVFFTILIHAQNTAQCDSLLKKGNYALGKKDYIKSLEFFTKARYEAKKHQWDSLLYRATMGIGNNYYGLLDFGEALNYFLEAYTIGVKNSDAEEELAALTNIANLYTKQEKYPKAIEYYNKAYDIAAEKNISSRKGLPLMNIGYIYNHTNQPVKARPYILQSLPFLKGTEHYLSANILLIENNLLLGSAQTARQQALSLYSNTTDADKQDLDIFAYLIVAKSYFAEKNYPDAIRYANKIFEKHPNLDLDLKRDIFELLTKIYQQSNLFDKALQYKDSVITADRKLDEIRNGSLFYNNSVKFEVQNYKNQIVANEQKVAGERKIFYFAIAFIFGLVIIILLILRQKQIVAEAKQNASELNLEKQKNNNLLLEKKVTDALLEQEQLKNEIEIKNRKLSAKALYLSDRNNLIEEIVTYLSSKPQLANDPTLSNHIRSLKANLRTDNEWDNFITHFEEVNHGFLHRLKTQHPSLSANDIRFIAYIYMNLSIKEISSILNITIIACKKRKERLCAKMDVPKDVDLYEYISSF